MSPEREIYLEQAYRMLAEAIHRQITERRNKARPA